jgi:hypothetical protein
MRVTPESPVQDKQSYLYQWDTTARQYFNHFEIHKQAAREGLRRLFQNLFTRNRDPIQFEHRFREVDTLVNRQLLGDISEDEVHELNSAFGQSNSSFYFKGMKEPASIIAWKLYPIISIGGLSTAIAGYARFVKGYNNLWFVGAYAPLWTYLFYNYVRQPTIEVDNCYRYLLAKRAATAELQANQARFVQNGFAQSEKLGALRAALESKNITIYQLEADIVGKINAGSWR